MKLIKCIVPAAKLEILKENLLNEGVQGMTIFDVKGFGIHRSQLTRKVSRNYLVEFQPQIMLEIVLADSEVEKIIRLIISTAQTGHLSDGKIFVSHVEDAVRVRTGEHGDAAL
ncbi:P-II family nitrogen regulator [bacterium]|nr:P-II family nitrogen regulator [bacterium]